MKKADAIKILKEEYMQLHNKSIKTYEKINDLKVVAQKETEKSKNLNIDLDNVLKEHDNGYKLQLKALILKLVGSSLSFLSLCLMIYCFIQANLLMTFLSIFAVYFIKKESKKINQKYKQSIKQKSTNFSNQLQSLTRDISESQVNLEQINLQINALELNYLVESEQASAIAMKMNKVLQFDDDANLANEKDYSYSLKKL